ncbi:NAD(P)-binding protein [Mycena rosella]|uniref:NAD(P)-binding protein n=1 Tax=Mycena rosella TaxID=1033263 RepID=A0AAD7AXM1_MYCRO|nr:NAD(P)-binding protein [Mycena rosella]KAJ7683585.1 NAD(P)-binding protein [Mycena rosella]
MFSAAISEDDLIDLHGKVAILTGGNTGIGYATIQMLARKGAKVYMAARNGERAKEAIEKLKAENINDGSVHWHSLDLSDPRAVQRSAKEFLEKEERLDILINNAAAPAGPFKLAEDGISNMMVINHISHFVLTETLLPLMKATAKEPGADVRIVNVSSSMHARVQPTTFATKDAFNSDHHSWEEFMDAYGTTKLANILHVKALQTRLNAQATAITCIALHPGAVKTAGLQDALGGHLGWFLTACLTTLFFKSWRSGAMTVAFAAAGKKVADQREKYRGAYLVPTAAIAIPSRSALDERLQSELYESTERFVTEMGL